MKKLIIAAVAITLGVVSNAATVNWSASDISFAPGGSGDARKNYVAYLFDTSAGASTIAAAVAKGDMTVLSQALGTKNVSSAGKVVAAQAKDAPYSAGDYVTAFAIVLDNATPADAKNYLLTSEVKSASAVTTAGAVTVGLGSQAKSTWSAVTAAPEPTSGLLLLLGMAGLALRRRRA